MTSAMTEPTLPRAVLLDLDDTILNDSGNVGECWREACLAHRQEIGIDPETVIAAVSRIRDWYWADPDRHREGRLDLAAARREIVRLALAELGQDAPQVVDKIATHYAEHRDRGIRPFEGSVETVHWLREKGCRLALLTNGNGFAQREKVARFDLGGLFDTILVEGELGYGKPDSRVYRLALDRLGIPPEATWMVGDNLEWDVAAPQRLGIFGIWIDVRGAGLPSESGVRPDRIVRRLAELMRGVPSAARHVRPAAP